MIKVKETKSHPIPYSGEKNGLSVNIGHKSVLVAEGKLVLVQTKYITSYSLIFNDDLYNPILISETEKIEVGNKYAWYDGTSWSIRECISLSEFGNTVSSGFKILALPKHFSPKLLQDIVDGKLKEGDRVLVECEETHDNETIASSGGFKLEVPINIERRIKLNSSGHITVLRIST